MFKIQQQKTSRGDSGILPSLNGLLIGLVVLLLMYIMYELLLITKDDEGAAVKSNMAIGNTLEEEESFLSAAQPFNYYSGQLEKRDIFLIHALPAPPVENIVKPEVPVANAPNAMDLIKNLTLVGIVLDQNPTVIIEDQQSKETLFLHVGDKVNEAVIEEVQKSKVILNFHGQRVELNQ